MSNNNGSKGKGQRAPKMNYQCWLDISMHTKEESVNTTTSTHHGDVNTATSSTITSNVPVPPQPYKTPEDERINNNGPASPLPSFVPPQHYKTPEDERGATKNSGPASTTEDEDASPVDRKTNEITNLIQGDDGDTAQQVTGQNRVVGQQENGWQCRKCTFLNHNVDYLACEVCKTTRFINQVVEEENEEEKAPEPVQEEHTPEPVEEEHAPEIPVVLPPEVLVVERDHVPQWQPRPMVTCAICHQFRRWR
jgi:hypothetical protein